MQQKVEFFQKSGYQDMDFCLPGLELLLVWNAFDQMQKNAFLTINAFKFDIAMLVMIIFQGFFKMNKRIKNICINYKALVYC